MKASILIASVHYDFYVRPEQEERLREWLSDKLLRSTPLTFRVAASAYFEKAYEAIYKGNEKQAGEFTKTGIRMKKTAQIAELMLQEEATNFE